MSSKVFGFFFYQIKIPKRKQNAEFDQIKIPKRKQNAEIFFERELLRYVLLFIINFYEQFLKLN